MDTNVIYWDQLKNYQNVLTNRYRICLCYCCQTIFFFFLHFSLAEIMYLFIIVDMQALTMEKSAHGVPQIWQCGVWSGTHKTPHSYTCTYERRRGRRVREWPSAWEKSLKLTVKIQDFWENDPPFIILATLQHGIYIHPAVSSSEVEGSMDHCAFTWPRYPWKSAPDKFRPTEGIHIYLH
jgi:hypothetical protein